MDSTSSTESSELDTKTFNSYDYGFEITLMDKVSGLYQKFTKGEIIELTLIRDITEYYTTGSVKIKDDGNILGVLANHNGDWAIMVNIVQNASVDESNQDNTNASKFQKLFLISNVGIDSIDANGAHITIDFVDPIAQILNRNCAYSNQECEDISSILTGLFESVGFSESLGETADDPRALPTIDLIGTYMSYITDGSTPVINHIDHIISQIYTEDKGFLFMFFDPLENKFKSYWSKTALAEDFKTTFSFLEKILKIADISRIIEISTSDDSSKSTSVATQLDVYNSLLDYRDATHLIYPTYIQNFNYQSHRMESDADDKWNDQTFLNLFKQDKLPNTDIPTVLEDPMSSIGTNYKFYESAPDYAIGNFYRKSNRDEFYKKLRNYFLYSNMFSVKMLGDISRKPGVAYLVKYAQFPNADKLNGAWFCPRIVDVFSGQEYYQHIFLTRLSDTVEMDKIAEEMKKQKEEVDAVEAEAQVTTS